MWFAHSGTLCFTLLNGRKNVRFFEVIHLILSLWRCCLLCLLFFFSFLASSISLRGRSNTVSCCLPADFLPDISYRLSSLRSIVFGLCFRAVFCLRDLLLTQVQRWTKITPPTMLLCPFSISLFFLYIPYFFMELSQLIPTHVFINLY